MCRDGEGSGFKFPPLLKVSKRFHNNKKYKRVFLAYINVVDRSFLQAMSYRNSGVKLDTAINSLSANHLLTYYLETIYRGTINTVHRIGALRHYPAEDKIPNPVRQKLRAGVQINQERIVPQTPYICILVNFNDNIFSTHHTKQSYRHIRAINTPVPA